MLQSLVPAFAHAAASAARAQFDPGRLCSVDSNAAGLRLAAATTDTPSPAPPPALPSAAHCPFCALPIGACAPAPEAWTWDAAPIDTGVGAPLAEADVPPPLAARGRPQEPRAPPRG